MWGSQGRCFASIFASHRLDGIYGPPFCQFLPESTFNGDCEPPMESIARPGPRWRMTCGNLGIGYEPLRLEIDVEARKAFNRHCDFQRRSNPFNPPRQR